MRRRPLKRHKKHQSGAPKWMVTYSDMVTLILVFFILLFSMSQIDSVKFDAVTESFQSREIFDFAPSTTPIDKPLNPDSGETGEKPNPDESSVSVPNEIDEDRLQAAIDKEDTLNKLMGDVETYLDENDLNDVASATRSSRGIELVLQESILFDSGEADVLAKGKPFLNEISTLLKNIPNYIRVEGHTDNRPISNYKYPSNWELSSSRAGSVIRYFVNKRGLDEFRFSAVGYGDTKPLVPNDSEKNWSKNRRVEIIILEEGKSHETER